MNVLHVHSGNIFGGVERMLEALAPARAGDGPVRSSYALCFDGRVSGALRAAGADVHLLGPAHVRHPGEVRRARLALRRVLESGAWTAALVHSSWSQALFGSTLRSAGLPFVRWMHAPAPGPRWMEYWAQRSRPALVLCNSRYTHDRVASRLAPLPVAVQYPPVVLHAPVPGARAAVRASLGTPDEAVVIVLAARLELGKGHALLIDALADLPGAGWECWIAGGVQQPDEQRYLHELRRQADAAGLAQRVRFLGHRDDVAAVLGAADVYCQPNTAPDSFGLSFVEAMAAGLPVITTNMGAASEIIDDTCGVLLDPGDVAGLGAALRRFAGQRDERIRMGAAAAARARALCDLPRSLAQLSVHIGRAAADSRPTT